MIVPNLSQPNILSARSISEAATIPEEEEVDEHYHSTSTSNEGDK
jgi:hypothetical protein